jgi:uncharacterized protein (TIGR00251 family)
MAADMNWISDVGGGAIVQVRVVPRAAQNAVQGFHGDYLKIRLQAPPVDGKANAALVEFLSGLLGIPRRQVALLAGATGRKKRLLISGLSAADVKRKLGLT